MKLAHMSDLHYSATHLAESNRCFGAAVSHAIEIGVQAAVITGDATDHALDAHEPAFRELAKQIQRLANHCPVLMLQGTFSHEPRACCASWNWSAHGIPLPSQTGSARSPWCKASGTATG